MLGSAWFAARSPLLRGCLTAGCVLLLLAPTWFIGLQLVVVETLCWRCNASHAAGVVAAVSGLYLFNDGLRQLWALGLSLFAFLAIAAEQVIRAAH